MPKYISAKKLIVLRKVPQPQITADFRPISCCNTIYKWITKLLCQRIKGILPEIIDQSQGAFIKGRELLYNVLICQDIARDYQRKTISPRCILKIDLQKAWLAEGLWFSLLGVYTRDVNSCEIPIAIHQMGNSMCNFSPFHYTHKWIREWIIWRKEGIKPRGSPFPTTICDLNGVSFKAYEEGKSATGLQVPP